MTTIPELSETLQRVLTDSANRLASERGFIRRQRQVTGANFAQALVLGGLSQAAATRKQVHQSAVRAGMGVSVQGLDQRFTPRAVIFMRRLLEAALSELLVSDTPRPLLPQFNGVYVTDCTRLNWGSLGLKMAVRLDLQGGGLQAHLSDITCNNQKTEVVAWELKKAGHKADEIAAQLGKHRATIYRWLRGIRQRGIRGYVRYFKQRKRGQRQRKTHG